VFEQLSGIIGRRVMVLQSDGKKVANAGLYDKNNPEPKVLKSFYKL